MTKTDLICMGISLLIPLFATLYSFVYGAHHFFQKRKPLCMQTLTMAMGSHALGSIYQLCLTLTNGAVFEGFTPAYLGRIGFFLFFLAATYGQLDKIVDDGSVNMRRARILALIAPLCAALLYIPNAIVEDVPVGTKIAYAIVWIPAVFSLYFNLKHAIIPDLDFGFIKAIKPYNIFAVCLGFSELLCLTAWNYLDNVFMLITASAFGILCVCTMVAAKKGVEKWTI